MTSKHVLRVVGVALLAMAGGCSSRSTTAEHGIDEGSTLGARSGSTLDEAVALMAGTFSNAAQASADPEFRPITLHMTPIWGRFSQSTVGQKDPSAPRRGHGLGGAAGGVEGGSERWLYVEQALTTMAEKPYRQRVYRVTTLAYTDVNGRVQEGIRSEVWELPGDPLRYAGAWRSVDPLGDIGPESLTLKEGCEVLLFRGADGVWRGSTVGCGCASSREGASYTMSLVEMDAKGLRTLDRGFDAQGTQVWGSTKGAYDFRRE